MPAILSRFFTSHRTAARFNVRNVFENRERVEDIKDKHKAKKKAKQAAETAESEDGLHRSASRLELTEEERADPELQPYIHKAGAKADKLDAARAALPKKRVPVKEKIYDAASGKAKSTLRFEQQDKGPPSLKPKPACRAALAYCCLIRCFCHIREMGLLAACAICGLSRKDFW